MKDLDLQAYYMLQQTFYFHFTYARDQPQEKVMIMHIPSYQSFGENVRSVG